MGQVQSLVPIQYRAETLVAAKDQDPQWGKRCKREGRGRGEAKKRSLNGASFDTPTPTMELGLRMIRLPAIRKRRRRVLPAVVSLLEDLHFKAREAK